MLPGFRRMQCAPASIAFQRQRVVEVDVRDHRDRRLDDDRLERLDVLLARDGHAHDVGAGVRDAADLESIVACRLAVSSTGHSLHHDRGAAADLHASDVH